MDEPTRMTGTDAPKQNSTPQSTPTTQHKRWVPWLAGGVAVCVGVGGVWAWNTHQDTQALDAFNTAQQAAIEACTPPNIDGLDELLTSAENIKDGAELAQTTTTTQAQLHTITKSEPPTTRSERVAQAETLNQQADECANTHVTLTEAITALTGALTEHARTAYEAAVKTANNLITSAQDVINNSEHKVTDNHIRLNAQKILDELKTLTATPLPEDADWKTINTTTSELTKQTKATTDAIKTITDAQTTWETTQTQTAAGTPAAAATTNTGGWTSNTDSSGSSWTPNTTSAGDGSWTPTPTPPTPSQNTGGNTGGGWVETSNEGGCMAGGTSREEGQWVPCS